MKKALLGFFILALAFPGVLAAQGNTGKTPHVRLVYFDDDKEIVIKDNKGKTIKAMINLMLLPEYVIQTKKSTAELQLVPNGTVVKLTQKTTFKIESLQGYENAKTNDFALNSGKIRVVANKILGGGPSTYSIKTPTTVCGVRGTDFAMMFDSEALKDWLCVTEGLVAFTNLASNVEIPVAAGQFVDVAKEFLAKAAPAEWLTNNLADVQQFLKAPLPNGKEVAFEAPAPENTTTPPKTTEAKDPALNNGPTGTNVASSDPSGTPKDGTKPEGDKAAGDKKDGLEDSWLGKLLGLDIGSVTIDGKTYSKAVIAPIIDLDKFRLGLYLPVIYTKDLFNPSDWYKPRGNNEWSFGTDSSFGEDWLARGGDFLSDLALKIKFLEIGKQGFDSTYVKVGNLNTMAVGNGSIVRNFANDEDFPAVRKVGLNVGLDFNPVLLEALVDDLSQPQVFGGRLGFSLVKDSTEIGLTVIMDNNLGNLFTTPTVGDTWAVPKFFNAGMDFVLFKVNSDLFRAKLFLDGGTWLTYYDTDYLIKGTTNKPLVDGTGFQWSTMNNLGAMIGLEGRVALLDFLVDLRYAKGIYRHGLFGPEYNRSKNTLIKELTDYYSLDAAGRASAEKAQTLGITGRAGADLFGILKFTAGYTFPMSINPDTNEVKFGETDRLIAKLELLKDKLPVVDISGTISYERTKFGPTLWNMFQGTQGLYLFDANTVVKGEIVYGLDPHLDLVIGVTTNLVRDANGKVIYESDGLTPKMAPSLNLETRISF